MTKTLTKRCALFASVLTLSLASPALAAPPKKPVAEPAPPAADPVTPPAAPADAKPVDPNQAEAQQHFKNGLELFKKRAHDASLVEFERAYTLSNNYKVLYNIALVYRDMNNFAGAVDTFDRYFAEGGSDIDAFRRAEVEAEYNRLAVYVAQLTVTSNLAGAEVSIDDVPVGRTPFEKPIRINAGTRRKVSIQHDNAPAISKFIKAAGGEKVSVAFDLTENKATASNQDQNTAPKALPPPPPEKPSKFTTLSWIGLGAAGALGIGAVITGVSALHSSSNVKSGLYTNGSPVPDDLESSKSSARALGIVTDVLIVAAVATAGITLVLTLTHEPKPKPATASFRAPPPQLGFKVAGAGGALVGSF